MSENNKTYSAKYFDEVELIWFNPETGKKLKCIIPSNKRFEKDVQDRYFMLYGGSYCIMCGTNTGVFRLRKFNAHITKL
jgi:hypothetical protein